MADVASKVYVGHCHCGAISFEAAGLADIWYCHCRQCRRLTGHYMAAARAQASDVMIRGTVRWTPVSERSEHGFCASCCSPMFWRNRTQSTLSVLAGNIDDTDGLEVKGHVFVAEKGAYYEINDGLPQFAAYPEGGV